MTIKVLMIDPDITFIIPVKRALETMGDYVVSGFASGKAGLEQARRERFDITIIDARVEDIALPLLIGMLRIEQPRLPIILSGTEQAQGLNIQRVLPKPYFARHLNPLIREMLDPSTGGGTEFRREPLPPQEFPALRAPMLVEPPRLPDDTFSRLVNAMQTDDTVKRRTIQSLNKVLRNLSSAPIEEPAIPENATIRDMVTGQSTIPPESLEDTVPTRPVATPPDTLPEMPAVDDLAAATLSMASDDNVPLDQLSLQAFVETVKERGPGLVPMLADALRTVDQPSFVEQVIEATPEATRMEQIIEATPETTPEAPIEAPGEAQELRAEESPPGVPERVPEFSVIPAAPETPAIPDEVAALAVQLTQLTVDSTAQATLLTRGKTLIAAAGPLGGTPGMAERISVIWAGDRGDTLIHYLFLPDVGDVLLYSTVTLDGMWLSMLFPADTPVKSIRKLADHLVTALERVPEPPAAEIIAPPVESDAEAEAARTLISRPTDLRPPDGLREAMPTPTQTPELPEIVAPRAEGPYAGYGFVWLPRADTLAPEVTDRLIEVLNRVAAAHAWTIEGTEIQPGYVSVQISIPANETPTTAVETLMGDTAARVGNESEPEAGGESLWADGYYVVAPGRPITAQEIAQFVEYQRGAA